MAASSTYAAGRCRVYALDVPAATGMRLHNSYTPCEWEHNQFAADARLHAHLTSIRHPWLVSNPREADVVLITGHGFDRWCVAQTVLRNRILEAQSDYRSSELRDGSLCASSFGGGSGEACGAPHSPACKRAGRLFRSEQAKRMLWEKIHDVANALNASAGVPRVLVNLNNECPPASLNTRIGHPADTLILADRVKRAHDGVVPFVLSRPAWLLGDGPIPPEYGEASSVPWRSRTLLFFAGHVPKLYVRPTRYLLWRAWRRDPRVSVYTKDIACALSAHHICASPQRWQAEHVTFCQADCGTTRACKGSVGAMQRECRSYQRVDWASELPDVPRTNRALNRSAYLKAAMSHRFCVVAPGDYPSTPKITEFVAVGARGGCLPLLVVPTPVAEGASRQLPYASTWLDYCEIAYLVPESAVSNARAMAKVLDALDAVTAEEADAKRRALRRVRDAFVTRTSSAAGMAAEAAGGGGRRGGRRRSGGGVSSRTSAPPPSPLEPAASDFLLHEACQLARRYRAASAGRRRRSQAAGGQHSTASLARCLLPGRESDAARAR